MKKRFTEEQIIRILREVEVTGTRVQDVCRKHNIVEHTFYRWCNKFDGLEESGAHKFKEMESENAKLKHMVAEQMLVINGLKEFSGKYEHLDWSEDIKAVACRSLGFSRRVACHYLRQPVKDRELGSKLMATAQAFPRFGYRRTHSGWVKPSGV